MHSERTQSGPTLVGLAAAALLCAASSGAHAQHTSPTKTTLTRTMAVTGHVGIRLKSVSADVTVTAAKTKTITVVLRDTDSTKLELDKRGSTINIQRKHWVHAEGKFEITVPLGTDVELKTVSGDVKIHGPIGKLETTTVSGDIHSKTGTEVEVRSVSGDIELGTASGDVSVTTVSGDARITTIGGAATQLSFRTTSGDLNWSGTCGKGCKMRLASLSGALKLGVSKASSFTIKFKSFSGSLKDHVSMKQLSSRSNSRGGGRTEAQYGAGAGRIEVSTFSGDVKVRSK